MSDLRWDERLFVKHAEFYLPILQDAKKTAKVEVKGLCKIFKEFQIDDGAKILDLFCGIGRHSIKLAKIGYNVVGYDPSSLYLTEAKKWSDGELPGAMNLRFLHGSPSNISQTLKSKGENQFDVIIIMSNCLGYRDEMHDLKLLRDVRSLSKRNSFIIVEIENRDWRIRNFESFVNYYFEETEIHEIWRFDPESSISISDSMFYKKDRLNDLKLQLKLKTTLRLYALHELKAILEKAGWQYIKSYGDFVNLTTADWNSKSIITISRQS